MIWRIIGTIGAASFFISGFSILGNPDCISADIGGGRVVGVTCYDNTYGAFSAGAATAIMISLGSVLLSMIYWKELSRILSSDKSKTRSNFTSNLVEPIENIKKINNDLRTKNRFNTDDSFKIVRNQFKICNQCSIKIRTEWAHCAKCLGTSFRAITESDLKMINDVTQIKVCDGCNSELHVFYPKCFKCEGTTFTHKNVTVESLNLQTFNQSPVEIINASETTSSRDPEFKTCPMCAEDIKFAAKKCRYCQHMLD